MACSVVIGEVATSALIAQARQTQVIPWPGRSISVYDQSGFLPSLTTAVLQWDNAGIATRFIITDDPQAEVVVRVDQRACRDRCAALTEYVGYRPGGMETIYLSREPSPLEKIKPTYYMTRVLVHELGHVLGLHHNSGCSVMSSSFMKDCGLANQYHSENDIRECGPLPVDVAAAQKIYGKYSWPKLSTGCAGELS